MKMIVDGAERKLRAVWFENGKVRMIEQRKLPEKIEIFDAENSDAIAYAIKSMVVRGAPAIGVAAAFGLAMAKSKGENMNDALEKIKKTRPTAFDLFKAIEFMKANDFELNAAERVTSSFIFRYISAFISSNPLFTDFAKLKPSPEFSMAVNVVFYFMLLEIFSKFVFASLKRCPEIDFGGITMLRLLSESVLLS